MNGAKQQWEYCHVSEGSKQNSAVVLKWREGEDHSEARREDWDMSVSDAVEQLRKEEWQEDASVTLPAAGPQKYSYALKRRIPPGKS